MRDAIGSEPEKEDEAVEEEQIEVIDVEEYAKEPETTQLSAEETTMVVDEQAPPKDLVQKASIGLPAKVFTQPPTFLASKPEASIEDHFLYIYYSSKIRQLQE
ncbi:hypothetical protein L6452_20155 [Arctium lappa]|uniref:Uncharacterized protein n=1 Tax=Arctium lappa TaxID=4217 RepID=A0ACB9BEZ5_ARCLA|nr:hypothetical protein L6452_20155 [Arctium lappa]